MSLRNRRMDVEWSLLEKLAETNPCVLGQIERTEKEFFLQLRETPAWTGAEGLHWIVREHAMRYVFPRYYPALPIEGYVALPVIHPNVDPVNGLVCLWRSFSATQTIVDAVVITRAVLSWSAVNSELEHCMQGVRGLAALAKTELTIPDACRVVAPAAGVRKRIEAS
jgi:hypothetical protein